MTLAADRRTVAAVAITFVLWSSAFPSIRFALRHISPGHVTLLRFLVAGTALALYGLAAGIRLPSREVMPRVLAVAFLATAVYHTCLNFGLVRVMSGAGGLIVNTAPVFTALLAALVLRERVPPGIWAGICVSFAGTVVIGLGQPAGTRVSWGAVLLLGSALAWAASTVLQKPLLESMAPLHLTAWTVWLGAIPLLVFAPGLLHDLQAAPLSATLAVVYIGVGPIAIACVTWAYALSRMPAARLASMTYLMPVMNAIMAWFALGEVPTPLTFVGGALAVAGVVLVGVTSRRARPDEAASSCRDQVGRATT